MKFFKRKKKNRTTNHLMGEFLFEAEWKDTSIPIGVEWRIARLDEKIIDQALLQEILTEWITLISPTLDESFRQNNDISTVEVDEKSDNSYYAGEDSTD